MRRKLTTQTISTRTGLAALIIAFAGGTAAVAQNDDLDDWEWEPDEGYHEQEWYDPSDWFDTGVEYEADWGANGWNEYERYDDYDWSYVDEGYDSHRYQEAYWDDEWDEDDWNDDWDNARGDDEYDWGGNQDYEWNWNDNANSSNRSSNRSSSNDNRNDQWGDGNRNAENYYYDEPSSDRWDDEDNRNRFGARDRQEDANYYYDEPSSERWDDGAERVGYYDAYHDGYYDGYNDDQYGFDDDTALEGGTYSSGYADGYYDGYYDQVAEYDYDPYYYIITVTETERDRRSDQQRAGDDTRRRGDREQTAGAPYSGDRKADKVRGTVDSVSILQGEGRDDGPLIAHVRLQDGESAIINLGPNMTRTNLPFREGDRVTFCGKETENNGRTVLRVHTIRSGGETAQLAPRQMTGDTRKDRPQDRPRDRARERDGVMLSGRLEDVTDVNIGSERYTVLRISLRDGQERLIAVDDNTVSGLQDLDAQRGDRIQIGGHTKTVQGRQVLVADRLRVNGEQLVSRR